MTIHNFFSSSRYALVLCLAMVFLSACSHLNKSHRNLFSNAGLHGYLEDDGPPTTALDLDAIADAIPHPEPLSRYGNPEFYAVSGTNYHALKQSKGYSEEGLASWYGKKWHGKRTSSGEPYDIAKMTAAHRTLPLPTYVRVTNLSNGKKVVVKVNDRGPFRSNRIIDLSYAAAAKLGIVATGTAKVLVEAMEAQGKTIEKIVNLAKKDPSNNLTPFVKKNIGSSDIFLQLGSFAYRENANSLSHEIESLTGKSPIIVETSTDHPFYQVKIGPFKSEEEAQALITTLTNSGHTQPVIVHA